MGFTRGLFNGGVASPWNINIGGPSVSYRVFWDMTADGLDTYDATDGSTTTTNALTYSADGAQFDAAGDYARFTCTDSHSINKAVWTIGFRYKKVGTPASWCFFLEHSYSTKAIALVRYGASTTDFYIYIANFPLLLTSTITTFYDGNEHSLVLTYNDSTDTITLSIDGETPVPGSLGYSVPTLDSGYLSVGNDVALTTPCMGIMSDFYIL